MPNCVSCTRENPTTALLCKSCQRVALRSIRRDAAEREEMLMEREPE